RTKALELRALPGSSHEFLHVVRQKSHGSAAAVLKHHAKAARGADARNGRRRDRKNARLGNARKLRVEATENRCRAHVVGFSFVPRFECDEAGSVVTRGGAREEVEAGDAR